MFFLEMTTIPDPFCVDVSDPKFKRLIDHTTSSIQTRRPTHAEVKKKLVNINARLDKNRIMFDKLKEEIPEMMVEVLIWEKYLQHKEAQDQEKSEQKNEEDALRTAQLELDAKKRELKGRKSVKVVRNMLLTEPTDLLLTAPAAEPSTDLSLANLNLANAKVQIYVKDPTGVSHAVDVDLSANIDDLFHFAFRGYSIPLTELAFLNAAGHVMYLGKTFQEQGVSHMSTIHMIRRLRGGAAPAGNETDQVVEEVYDFFYAFPATPFDVPEAVLQVDDAQLQDDFD